MSLLLLQILVMYGITFGIKDSKLFLPIRQRLSNRFLFFYRLFTCPYCVGFHSGWLTYLLFTSLGVFDLRYFLAYAFAGVTVSGTFEVVLVRIEGPKSDDEEDEEDDERDSDTRP